MTRTLQLPVVPCRRALLDGLARDADIFQVVSEFHHPSNDRFPARSSFTWQRMRLSGAGAPGPAAYKFLAIPASCTLRRQSPSFIR